MRWKISTSHCFLASHKSALSGTYLMHVCTKVRFTSSYFGHDIKKKTINVYITETAHINFTVC